METKEVMLPFNGFYESVHNYALDWALEGMLMDDRGDIKGNLGWRAFDNVNWAKVFEAYAQMYAECFADCHFPQGVESRFMALESPSEYNFTTDRIFIELPSAVVAHWFAMADPAKLDSVCNALFTTRSGFVSHYSPNWREWDLSEVDHNQAYAALLATVGDYAAEWEQEWAQDNNGNGELDNIIWSAGNDEFERVINVADYLRHRQNRQYALAG